MKRAPVGVFEGKGAIDGTWRLVAYRALPEQPLVVLVGLSNEGILAPWRQSAIVAGLATAIAIAISALLLWLALRYARREAQAQAASVQAAKLEAIGRTTSGVAHDFNNLLAGLSGALQLLERRVDNDARLSAIVAQGLMSVERGRSLVSQLLNVTRREIELESLDINTVLQSMTILLTSVAAPKADIRLDLAPDLPHCQMDPSRLGAAILNLVVNARDAMPEDRETEGQIVISSANGALRTRLDDAAEDARTVSLTVRDNGGGMDPEVKRRALEPFFTTKGKQGTGLGLAQVQTFVHDMGGHMEIESEPGHGTAVRLSFRCMAAPAAR